MYHVMSKTYFKNAYVTARAFHSIPAIISSRKSLSFTDNFSENPAICLPG